MKKEEKIISRKFTHSIVRVLIITMPFVPVVISVEMILLLLLERQRQNSFACGRYASPVHYFRSGSESVKEKSIYLNDSNQRRRSGIYEATCVIGI